MENDNNDPAQTQPHPDSVLCAACNARPTANSEALLCSDCDKAQRQAIIEANAPKAQAEISERDLSTGGIHELRQLNFAPVSVRYSGKTLDEIAWAMLPAMPEQLQMDIRRHAANTARLLVTAEPTIQDLDAMADFHVYLGNLLRQLSTAQKDKIILKARPELKRQEKERKEAEKEKKIQSSLPKDAHLKHAANVILDGLADIIAPADKTLQATLKAFLDYVSLQAQVEDEITAAWLNAALMKPKYAPLRTIVKVKG